MSTVSDQHFNSADVVFVLRRRSSGGPDTDGNQFHAISHSSVSRRHFELHVHPVNPGASGRLHERSTITIRDLGSKTGTRIDDQKIQGKEHSFSSGDHVIRLGNYPVLFHIRWKPHVFTFPGISRDARASHRQNLEELDIKCTTEFVPQQTSHVATERRNTTPVLRALVAGRYVVTSQYLEAVRSAAEREPIPEGDAVHLSPLEQDWDRAWPKELDYLPPPGTEIDPFPANDPIFLPNEARSEIFNKYVFIFVTLSQYETFLPVVTGGGGKALFQDCPNTGSGSAFEAFIDFVKSCAGEKGDRALRLSQYPNEEGAVVVVRPTDQINVGGPDFWQSLDLALDQRSMRQNEFLNAILKLEPKSLRRPLEIEMVDDQDDSTAPGTVSRPTEQQAPTPPPSSVGVSNTATSRRARRNFTRQKPTNFDDFDPSQIQRYSPPPSTDQDALNDNQGSPVIEADAYAPANQPGQRNGSNSRKRPATSQLEPIPTTDQVLDGILTGATTLKKRRLEAEANGAKTGVFGGFVDSDDQDDSGAASGKNKGFKTEKEESQGIQAIIRSRKEEQDKQRQADEEYLKTAMEGIDISTLKSLAVVEEMVVPDRSSPSHSDFHGQAGWKPEWNGRANWKRFKKRRPGEAREEEAPHARRRVIVGLEEYNKTDPDDINWIGPSSRNRYNQGGRTSQPSRSQSLQSAGRRRRRDAPPVGGDDSNENDPHSDAGEVSRTSHENEDLRSLIYRTREEDEREAEERDMDMLEMSNLRDPQLRERQAREKKRRREKEQARSAATTTTTTVADKTNTQSAPPRRGLLDGLRALDDDDDDRAGSTVATKTTTTTRGAAGRKRAREADNDDNNDDDDDDGGMFRRRRRG